MTDGQNILDQAVKCYLRSYDSIRKVAGNDCKTGCLLDYNYFNQYCKMIAIDLNKEQALDADPKAIR